MPTWSVRALARRDIDGIVDHIALDNMDAALRFSRAVQSAIETLAAMPGMGRRREYTEPVFAEVRSWPLGGGFENYLIFYKPVEGGIEVLRVLHGARDVAGRRSDRTPGVARLPALAHSIRLGRRSHFPPEPAAGIDR